MGVCNGDFGSVTNIDGTQITVKLTDNKASTIAFQSGKYQELDYGYAATVHKAQGVTVNNSFIYIAGKGWDRFLSYVALTRHRHTMNLYVDQNEYPNLEALSHQLSSQCIKDNVLDWPLSYAIRRGFNADTLIGRAIDKIAGIKQSISDHWLYIRNYALFKSTRLARQNRINRKLLNKQATKVAKLVDLQYSVARMASQIKESIKLPMKFHQHPDYFQWCHDNRLKNKLGHQINKEYSIYKKLLANNRIDKVQLNKMTRQHQQYNKVASYIDAVIAKKDIQKRTKMARVISKDWSGYYSNLSYVSQQRSYPLTRLVKQIYHDACLQRVRYRTHNKGREQTR